jgi:hypothetical protein
MGALGLYILWQQAWLFRNWALMFEGLGRWFGLEVALAMSAQPYLATTVQAPLALSSPAISVFLAAASAAGLWALSSLLDEQRMPARYFLRGLALVVGLPALGFWALGVAPEVDTAAHVGRVFQIGYWFLLAVPVLWAAAAFVLPGSAAKKALWALVALLYFFFSVPLLALVHLAALVTLGAAWVPALNALGLVLLLSVHLISFYSLAVASQD